MTSWPFQFPKISKENIWSQQLNSLCHWNFDSRKRWDWGDSRYSKSSLVKAVVFPVVMYGCESWTLKQAECWRIYAFELYWRRLLRVPWTARRSSQFILKEISPEYSLEGLMMKLKLQYFGHLIRRTDSLEKTAAGKDWRQEKGTTEDEMVGWHHRRDGHEFE